MLASESPSANRSRISSATIGSYSIEPGRIPSLPAHSRGLPLNPYTIYSTDIVKFPTQAQQCRISLYLRARVIRLSGIGETLPGAARRRRWSGIARRLHHSPVVAVGHDRVCPDPCSGKALAHQSVLADAGHDVVTAVNGRQGLELLGKRPPDLVLLDFMMPIMDGPAMLKAMKEDPAYRNVPAVVMSSLPESAVAEAASGMYAAFLRKPFKLAAVIDTVRTVLGQQS
jgi:CheY-like chemotaxis protein